jgi:predicted cupin superfamily sugar epimerase
MTLRTPRSAGELIAALGLVPHPHEGGFYAETWRSDEALAAGALPARYRGARALGTAIYYLLTPATFSAMHRLASDEVFHFYLGDPVEMLLLESEGAGRVVQLGTDLAAGERPQVLVPRGIWQGSRLAPGGQVALLGTTVAPGFDPADFELGARAALRSAWPHFADRIDALTR